MNLLKGLGSGLRSIPQNPQSRISDLYYDTLSDLTLLTPHTPRTVDQLYAVRFIDKEGRVTEKGHEWIRTHPTESFGLEAI